MPLKLTTYYRGSEIPDFPGTNTFHSKELFQIYEETPGYTPLLIMASEAACRHPQKHTHVSSFPYQAM